MKFTRNDMTNQRIERITSHHAIVGIDVAKDIHAAQITDFRGRTLTPRHYSFTNTEKGFEKLLHWFQEAGTKHGKTSFLVGMEPTGHYWHNLANWLLGQNIEVVLVNPVTTHRNKENRELGSGQGTWPFRPELRTTPPFQDFVTIVVNGGQFFPWATQSYVVRHYPEMSMHQAIDSSGVVRFGNEGQILAVNGVVISGDVHTIPHLNGRAIPESSIFQPVQNRDTIVLDLFLTGSEVAFPRNEYNSNEFTQEQVVNNYDLLQQQVFEDNQQV